VRAIEVPTYFRDFDDYWSPFLGGQGSAPSYAMSLSEERRAELREQIRASLPSDPDGGIPSPLAHGLYEAFVRAWLPSYPTPLSFREAILSAAQ
jgi:hypothetical protein